MIGTYQWGDHIKHIKEEEIKRGRDSMGAASLQHAHFQILRPFVLTVPVEAEIHGVLAKLRRQSVTIFAFTVRDLGVAGVTHRQLETNRISFETTFPALRR